MSLHRSFQLFATALVALATTAGAYAADPDPADFQLVYENIFDGAEIAPRQLNDFGAGPVYLRMRVGGGVGDTYGPTWIDYNHANVTLGLAVILDAGETGLSGEALLDGVFEAKIYGTGYHLPPQTEFYFWFQVYDPVTQRVLNYINTADPIGECLGVGTPGGLRYAQTSLLTGGAWVTCQIDLSAPVGAPSRWECLSPNTAIGKEATYGCGAGARYALGLPVHNFGLITVDMIASAQPSDPNSYKMYFDHLKLWLPW